MGREFFLPSRIITGENILDELPSYITGFGNKALIVTGKTVCKLDGFKNLTKQLSECGIAYEVFTEITGEPDDRMIKAGAEAYTANKCDFIIAMGGGSPIDSMKAIAVWVKTGNNICDYFGKETMDALIANLDEAKGRVVCIAAGSSSEMQQWLEADRRIAARFNKTVVF